MQVVEKVERVSGHRILISDLGCDIIIYGCSTHRCSGETKQKAVFEALGKFLTNGD